MKICYPCVKKIFINRDYKYFITIKPPVNEKYHTQISIIGEYLLHRDLAYFLTKCMSEKGYLHYHGVISFKESQTPKKGAHGALTKKINRSMGFVTLDPMYGDLESAYKYIRADRNTNGGKYEQVDIINTTREMIEHHPPNILESPKKKD